VKTVQLQNGHTIAFDLIGYVCCWDTKNSTLLQSESVTRIDGKLNFNVYNSRRKTIGALSLRTEKHIGLQVQVQIDLSNWPVALNVTKRCQPVRHVS